LADDISAETSRPTANLNYMEMAKLTASDAAAYDSFGYSVAIDGDTVVVGASGDGAERGAAYVFRTLDGGATYVELAKLTAADAAADDCFGSSVAIDGSTVVIGAGRNWYANTGGALYVFRTTDGGATYDLVAKLTPADGRDGDGFGDSVAIDDGIIVVGARGDDDAGGNAGAVYVFRTTDGGATYDQVAKLTADDGAAHDYFGWSVAIDGNTIVVGAYFDGDGGWRSGAAYVFRTTDGGATYDQVAKLTAADAAEEDRFGNSVAIDGDTIVVGAVFDYYSNSGSAYVFRTSDGGATYGQVAKLIASDASSKAYFGMSVAIDGDTVVVRTPRWPS